MSPDDMKRWRDLLRLNKSQAVDRLGIQHKTLKRYEDGETPIPRHIALACRALANDLKPWGEQTP